MDKNVRGCTLSVYLKTKATREEGDCEIQEIDLRPPNLQSEFNRREPFIQQTKMSSTYLRHKNKCSNKGCPDWNNSSSKTAIKTSLTRDPNGEPIGTPMSGGRV